MISDFKLHPQIVISDVQVIHVISCDENAECSLIVIKDFEKHLELVQAQIW